MEYVHNPVWDLQDRLKIDNSIDMKTLLPVQVDTGCNFDYNSQIRFTLTGGDAYIVPSESFLYMEGRLVKDDGTPITKDAQGDYPNIVLGNNAPMYLFRDIKYTIDDVEIESFSRPGFATQIKGLLTKSSSYRALNQCWAIDNYDGQSNPIVEYSGIPPFMYPLTYAAGDNLTAADGNKYIKYPVDLFNSVNATNCPYAADPFAEAPTVPLIKAAFISVIKVMNEYLDAIPIQAFTDQITSIAKDDFTKYLNILIKNINIAVTNRTSEKFNAGFAARKVLLFNPLPNIMPEASAGLFSFYIPLNFIFDFCEDYDKVIYHKKHQLIMTRDYTDSFAIFRSRFYSTAAFNIMGKVKITNMKLYVKQLIPSHEQQEIMMSIPKTVSIAFRNKYIQSSFVPQNAQVWPLELTYNGGFGSPQYIIVGFQVTPAWAVGIDQQVNNAIFNNPLEPGLQLNVRNIRITINNNISVTNDYSCDFKQNKAAQLYKDFKDMRKIYAGEGNEDNCVDYPEFINLYRLYTFDISSPQITRDAGTVTVVLEFNFVTPTPALQINYYAMTFYDKEVVV